MSQSAHEAIYEAIASIRLIDPHTHINPHQPASSTLADILGYHYYTELVHSSGMPREEIEEEGLPPRELVRRLVQGLPNIENTANYQWLISICRTFFDFQDSRIDQSNWEALYDTAEDRMNSAEWPQMVLDQSNVEAVFLTNDFDDDLQGFDTNTYIPCLRSDDLVFHLAKPETRQRLEVCTGIELDGSLQSLRASLEQRFRHFVGSGARACAISIPPDFEPLPISDGRAATALDEVLRRGNRADDSHKVALSRRVFWTLAELCDQYGLPFDLMIGVNRGVYPSGVYQGQDLFDSRVSLIQYRELFNTFRDVKFPISVLASVTNQELVSYSWIFPNVITNGHWWYSNTPSFIARDAAARLEAVPRNNQIGYYSDAYKLEFVWPKFDMYRQILARILADHFVGFCGWSEEQAIELGRQVLRDNVDEIFPPPEDPEATTQMGDTYVDDTVQIDTEDLTANGEVISGATAAASAALAAGAIGIVEVQDTDDVDELDEIDVEEDVTDEAALADATVEDVQQLEDADDDFDDDEDAELDYLEEESPTQLQETVEEVRDSDFVVQQDDEYDTVDEDVLPELPTVLELQDTVRIDENSPGGDEFELDQLQHTVDPVAETVEMDALPTDDEIDAVDVPDVELSDPYAERTLDADDIEAEADDSPLFAGDILDESDEADVVDQPAEDVGQDGVEIRMLRGESSFTPDEDSMQARDPLTGELMFAIGQTEQDEEPEEIEYAEAKPQYDEADVAEITAAEEADVAEIEYEEGDDLLVDENEPAEFEEAAEVEADGMFAEADDSDQELEATVEIEEQAGLESTLDFDVEDGLSPDQSAAEFGQQESAPEETVEFAEDEEVVAEADPELEATVDFNQHPGLETTIDLGTDGEFRPELDASSNFADEDPDAPTVDDTIDFDEEEDPTIEETVDVNDESEPRE